MESVQDGMCLLNDHGCIVSINPAGCKMLGREVHDLVDQPWEAMFMPPGVLEAPPEDDSKPHERLLRHKDGEGISVELTRTAIVEHGHVLGGILVFRDLTERKQAEETIRRMAYEDPLTSFPNRVLFRDRLNHALANARRNERVLAVLSLDIDQFKHINDTLGHEVGDMLIAEVAQRLKGFVRESDTISRTGVDEFSLVLTEVSDTHGAVTVAKRIIDSFALPFGLAGRDLFVTASMGIGLYPADGDDATTLQKNADAAMYRAKEQRNTFQLYAAAMNSSSLMRLSLENSLRTALERGEFFLHYQPQVGLDTGRIVGAEALIRWQSPEHGLVSPANFIPMAEENGLIVPITEWVLKEACLQARTWLEMGFDGFRMSVNLSGRHLKDQSLVTAVTRALVESGLAATSLILELTESVLLKKSESTIKMLQYLSFMGVQFSIDDFGTEYSSLSYLRAFPINSLKIDRSFVQNLPQNRDDAAIVAAIVALAHSLNLNVVAEGVETEEQWRFLAEKRCDEIQGYYFSRPLSCDHFTDLLMKQPSIPASLKRAR